MWKCYLCKKEFEDDEMAIELRFGYISSEDVKSEKDYYDAFCSEEAILPLCDDCAIAYIKGEKIGAD